MSKNISSVTRTIYKEINEYMAKVTFNKLSVYAACASFYIFVSFIPFLMIVVAMIPFLPISQEDLTHAILDVIPINYSYVVESLVDDLYFHNTAALSVSIIAIVWASARGIMGITQGLNEIVKVKESRNAIVMRIRSAFYTVVLAIGMLLMVIVAVFGNAIIRLIDSYLKIPEGVTNILQYKDFFMLALMAVMFIFFFVALPNAKIKIKSQLVGAFVAALIWWAFTRLFAFYISTYNSYSMYGSFAVIIILGIWLYTGMYIMFMGAQLNEHLASKKGYKDEGKN